MIIQTAVKDDWERISEISKASGYIDYISQMGPSYLNGGKVIVAIDNNTIAGFLKIEELCDNTYWLSGLRVHPGFRRKGIARTLTEEAIRSARKHNFTAVRIAVSQHNVASLKLTESEGFKITHEMINFKGVPEANDTRNIPAISNKMVNYGWKYGYYTGESCGIRFKESGGITYSLYKNPQEPYSFSQIISGMGEIKLSGNGI
ncbi:MAG: GNAT family N-acetyltransferase, partial [Thermoplasmataceae archaeon]